MSAWPIAMHAAASAPAQLPRSERPTPVERRSGRPQRQTAPSAPADAAADPRRLRPLALRVRRAGPPGEAEAVGWVLRLLSHLGALHREGRAHGDVSAAALYTEGMRASGRARLAAPGGRLSPIGYWSPERLGGAPPAPADDVWAAAVTLYFLLTGAMPFAGAEPLLLQQAIAARRRAPLFAYGVASDELEDIIARAFDPSPRRRLSSAPLMAKQLMAWTKAHRMPRRSGRATEPEVDETPTMQSPHFTRAEEANRERAWLAEVKRAEIERER